MTDRDERKRASTDQTTHIAEYALVNDLCEFVRQWCISPRSGLQMRGEGSPPPACPREPCCTPFLNAGQAAAPVSNLVVRVLVDGFGWRLS
jgi:hypothetical protein